MKPMDENKIRLIPKDEWIAGGMQAYDEKIYLGESTGWPGVDPHFRIAPAQVTIVTGVPGHGKSEVMDSLAVNIAKSKGWRTAFLSPENFPNRRHIKKLAEKCERKRASYMGKNTYQHTVSDFMAKHFEFMDIGDDGAGLRDAFAVIQGLGVQMAIIDPWNHLDSSVAGVSETDSIKAALKLSIKFVRRTGIHLFIVAHPQKIRRDKNGDQVKPNAYDISGSAHWFNIPDNILMVWRNAEDTELWSLKIRWQPDNGIPGMSRLKFDPAGYFRDFESADAIASALNRPKMIGSLTDAHFRASGMPDGDL